METKTSGRIWKVIVVILAVMLAAGIAVSCALGAMALSRMGEQGEQIAQLSKTVTSLMNMNSDTVTQEDDVAVAGEYWIRSTLPISDAYRSGDTSALDDTQKETLDMASAVLDEIITQDMTPYEKEKAVYDWMCADLSHEGGVTVAIPTTSETSAEPYGVLKYGQAVCVGFATTFRLFMQMMDIPCMVVHNSYHSWDLVQLDGEWYHVDIYSDVGSGNYANFNMTDEMCSYGHDWDTSFYPAAAGLTYCYAYQSAEDLSDVYQLPQLVRQALEAEEPENLYFLVAGTQEQMVLSMLLEQTSSAVMDYGSMNGRDLWMDWNLQLVQDDLLVTVVLTDYDQEPEEEELSEAEQERIQQAVQDAFGDSYGGGGTDSGQGWEDTWTEDAGAKEVVLG